jgi:hypothetical protein
MTSAPQPKVRFQKPDEPAPSERSAETRVAASLTLPPPEQLGVGSTSAAAEVDWNAIHRRLDELGSQSLEVKHMADGYRCTCQLATESGRSKVIQTQGATKADAVRLALAQAEQWAQSN